MLRRDFVLALGLSALATGFKSDGASSRGPLFWLIKRGKARVFLLGFGDAKVGDESWFAPRIRQAFQESSELWLEVAPAEAAEQTDPELKARNDAEYQQLSHEPTGHTFFDELEPHARQRTLAWMQELGIKEEAVHTLRPWSAYYTINGAFWSQARSAIEYENVDRVLWKLAKDQGKSIGYEMPDGLAFAHFMAAMPQKAQSQYIEFLLNFLDDHKKGLDTSAFDWAEGSPTSSQRSLYRMRRDLPDLYRIMQMQRNLWWAHKIDELLSTSRSSFIAVGQMHVLGPDGIPSQLRRLRLVGRAEICEVQTCPAGGGARSQ